MSTVSAVKSAKLSVSKEVCIGLVSSGMEAYNMAIYSFAAPFLAARLFRDAEAFSAVFFSYCLVFAGSSLFYPLGAIYYGFIGDREGRQKTCTYSTLGLGVATGLMGLIPIDLLGSYAWIAFLLLIGAQSFFSGGEYHGSVVFSLEHAQEKRQSGLLSATSCLFAVAGLCLANAFTALSGSAEWGIRGCFWVGAVGGIVSYLLKTQCRETPEFAAIPRDSLETARLLSFMKAEWRAIGGGVLVLSFFIVSYAFIFLFLPLVHEAQMRSGPFDTLKSLLAYAGLLVAAGAMADHLGLRRVMQAGAWLFAMAVVPLCWVCHDLLLLQLILTSLACLVIGPVHGWLQQQFDVQKRCRGIFVSSAVAISLFNGSTVPLCLLLFDTFDSLAACACFPCAIALACFGYLRAAKRS